VIDVLFQNIGSHIAGNHRRENMSEEKKITKTVGLPPGTLVHVGEEQSKQVSISMVEYDNENLTQKEITSIDECFPISDTDTIKWINITGLHEVDVIENVGKHLDLHALILEDILNTEQRPKIEDIKNHVFITLKMLTFDEEDYEVDLEQLSIVLGKNYVISFEEKAVNALDILLNRLKKSGTRARFMNADYLAYCMIDIVVDNYFSLLEKINNRIEFLEDELMENPTSDILQDIYELKRELISLKKSIWPLREIIGSLLRLNSSMIQPSTLLYLEDVLDHMRQIMDTVDIYRDVVSGMLDTYRSSVSNKLNDIIKILTIFTSLFIPLTFITGLYGMNFSFMPELNWRFGYYFALSLMILMAIGMLAFFKRKKWL
jgi:magnesium transporter